MSTKNPNKKVITAYTGWDVAITNGTKQLQELEAMAARIREAIKYFEERKKSGDQFPGEEKLKEAGLI